MNLETSDLLTDDSFELGFLDWILHVKIKNYTLTSKKVFLNCILRLYKMKKPLFKKSRLSGCLISTSDQLFYYELFRKDRDKLFLESAWL